MDVYYVERKKQRRQFGSKSPLRRAVMARSWRHANLHKRSIKQARCKFRILKDIMTDWWVPIGWLVCPYIRFHSVPSMRCTIQAVNRALSTKCLLNSTQCRFLLSIHGIHTTKIAKLECFGLTLHELESLSIGAIG